MTTLIDRERLRMEFAGDEDILRELRDVFMGELPKMMSAIEAAVRAGDAHAVERAAHTLKGAVSNFQTPLVRDAAFVLEQQGRANNLAGSTENFSKLQDLMGHLVIELETVINKAS